MSLQERNVNTEISTAVDSQDGFSLRTARAASKRSAVGSNSVMTAKTQSRSERSDAPGSSRSVLDSFHQAASLSGGYVKYAVTFFLMAVELYVLTLVNIFHVAYFSYRNPSVAKDLIKTAYHLMKVSYDNRLLTLNEIYQVISNNLIGPMARQNRQHYLEQSNLETMKTGSRMSSRR